MVALDLLDVSDASLANHHRHWVDCDPGDFTAASGDKCEIAAGLRRLI